MKRNAFRIALPILVVALSIGLISTFKVRPPATAVAATTAMTSATATSCPAPREGIQKGLAVLWRQVSATSATLGRAQQIASYARSVGANSVNISFLINTSGAYGTRVYAGSQTPTLASLRQIVGAAKAAHLRVTLRPLIDESNIPRPRWRGAIAPTSPSAWFQSYGNLMVTYAKLAAATCIDEFTVGVELASLQRYTSAWGTVASRIRTAGYRGDLTYSANWNSPITYRFARRPGVDFYPSSKLSLSATSSQVTTMMLQAFSRMPLAFRTNLVIQETGFSAVAGSYAQPASWFSSSHTSTTRQQATWFGAACHAAIRIHAVGIYFWVVDSWANPTNPDPQYIGTFGFERRPAESVVRACFAQTW